MCIIVFECIVDICRKSFTFHFSRCIFKENVFTDVKLFLPPLPSHSFCFFLWLSANSVVFQMQPNVTISVLLVIDASFARIVLLQRRVTRMKCS